MSESDALLRKADKMVGNRRLMLMLNAVTYAAWMTGLAVNAGTSVGQEVPFWGYLQTAGMVGWILSLIGVGWTMLDAYRHRKSPSSSMMSAPSMLRPGPSALAICCCYFHWQVYIQPAISCRWIFALSSPLCWRLASLAPM